MKRAVLVIAHGSRVESASDDMFRAMDDIRRKSGIDIVEAGFLEITSPSIPEGIDICVGKGADEIIIVPYFLHMGRHVQTDLPRIIKEAALRHQNVRILLADHLGYDERLSDILVDRIREAWL